MKLDYSVVEPILSWVDAGLTAGLGSPQRGYLCVEAAVSHALGYGHTDHPPHVGVAMRDALIMLNDSDKWTCKRSRAQGLRHAAIAQMGSDQLSPTEFSERLTRKGMAEWPRRYRTAVATGSVVFPDIKRFALIAREEASAAHSEQPLVRAAQLVVETLREMNCIGASWPVPEYRYVRPDHVPPLSLSSPPQPTMYTFTVTSADFKVTTFKTKEIELV